ncbi:hypothetical protein [Bradyrhizobium vignae]|uniref:hypothetical protein n=1 Tax=Bradyrhizobium vignae TaxID=1549949 RepID=UPI00100B8B83|nr:hypothetical protein [Bradyrhizobium vignae]
MTTPSLSISRSYRVTTIATSSPNFPTLTSAADLPGKLLQSVMMILLSFVIAGVSCFTSEYRFRRMLVAMRKLFKPLLGYMVSYAVSAEAKEARKKAVCVAARACASIGERCLVELDP